VSASSEDFSAALKAYSLVAVVDSPCFEAEVTSFQTSFTFDAIILPSGSVSLNPLQPTSYKITNSWINIFGFLLLG